MGMACELLASFETERHGVIERAMEQLGIEFEVRTVSVADVDVKDNTFQTRLNVAETMSSVVKEYAERMKCGDVFPMIVLHEKTPGRFRVVAGRNRATAYNAAQNGKSSYSAYVVKQKTPPDLLKALSARENHANGVRQSSADAARVAAAELVKMPTNPGSRSHRPAIVRAVAAQYAVSDTTVRDHYYARLVEKEMLRVGVQPSGIAVATLRCLWRWTESAGWENLARAVSSNHTLPGLGRIVSDARRDRCDAEALAKNIEKAADECAGTYRPPRALKDPATVTLEHLSLALNDMRDLAPPRNLPDEQAEDISSMVEALRIACKEWKSR